MSAVLIVNGCEFPPPKRGSFQVTVETTVNSGRNANAAVVGTIVGRNQYKIEGLEWAGLDADIWHRMLAAVKDFYIPVTFEHPETGEFTTITMYTGTRTAKPLWLDPVTKKTVRYENCKLNLTDTGW